MADADFEDEETELDAEVELDEEDLDLDDDVEVEVEDIDAIVDVEAIVDEPVVVARAEPAKEKEQDAEAEDDDDEVVDLEEELHPDDVEDPLDVLLHERTTSERLDEDDDLELEEDDEPDARGDTPARIVPRREDEFRCDSCFLIKPMTQLALSEKGKRYCRDCRDPE